MLISTCLCKRKTVSFAYDWRWRRWMRFRGRNEYGICFMACLPLTSNSRLGLTDSNQCGCPLQLLNISVFKAWKLPVFILFPCGNWNLVDSNYLSFWVTNSFKQSFPEHSLPHVIDLQLLDPFGTFLYLLGTTFCAYDKHSWPRKTLIYTEFILCSRILFLRCLFSTPVYHTRDFQFPILPGVLGELSCMTPDPILVDSANAMPLFYKRLGIRDRYRWSGIIRCVSVALCKPRYQNEYHLNKLLWPPKARRAVSNDGPSIRFPFVLCTPGFVYNIPDL